MKPSLSILFAIACTAALAACGGSSPAAGSCAANTDCNVGQTCSSGVCVLGSGGGSGGGNSNSCSFNSDCPTGDVCVNSVCTVHSSAGGSGGGTGGGSAGGSAGGTGGGSAGGSAGGSGGGTAGGSGGGTAGGSGGGTAGGSGGGTAGGSGGGTAGGSGGGTAGGSGGGTAGGSGGGTAGGSGGGTAGGSGGGSAGGSGGGSAGGSGGGSAGGSGGGSAGGSGGGAGGGSASCTATADYGTPDVTSTEQAQSGADNNGNTAYEFDAYLNDPSDTDVFDMQLFAGYGAFTGGTSVTTGTFTISGDDADPANCGLCLAIYPAYDSSATTGDVYFATGGTVTITQLSPDLAGSITNVTFAHYTYDNTAMTITAVDDGCVSAIDELDFDAPVMGGSSGTCSGGTDYGTVTTTNQGAIYYAGDAQDDDWYQYAAALDDNNDVAYFELWDNLGVFTSGVSAGTYDISQDAVTDYSDCGACIFVLVNPSATDLQDLDPYSGDSDEVFMAVSGTLEINRLSNKFKGSLTNASFVQVDIDGSTGDVTVGSDCASLDSLTVNASVSSDSLRPAMKSDKLERIKDKMMHAKHARHAAKKKHGLKRPNQELLKKAPLNYTPGPK